MRILSFILLLTYFCQCFISSTSSSDEDPDPNSTTKSVGCEDGLSEDECSIIRHMHQRMGAKLKMTGPNLIENNGFPLETHTVTSEDGYITTLYRIPSGRPSAEFGGKNRSLKRKAVLLHHGFISNGFNWILNSVEKALAYRLADAGHDVWMTNNRGTYFSLGHTTLNYNRNRQYWNFSFHEIAYFDVPVIIDYVLNVTRQDGLFYISHSMGGCTFFAAMAMRPEYNAKILGFVGLAPAAFVGSTEAPFAPIKPFLLDYQSFHDDWILGPLVHPDLIPLMKVIGQLCSPRITSRWVCFAVLELIFGYDFVDTHYDERENIVAIGLDSTSIKTLFHLLQLWRSGNFQQYDFGNMKNLRYYGQSEPPKYELHKVTVPIALFCGLKDNLVACKDVYELSKALPNVKSMERVNFPKFNHIDFLYSKDVNELLYDQIVELVTDDVLRTKPNLYKN